MAPPPPELVGPLTTGSVLEIPLDGQVQQSKLDVTSGVDVTTRADPCLNDNQDLGRQLDIDKTILDMTNTISALPAEFEGKCSSILDVKKRG